jgi:glutamate 5-kinase
VAIGAKSDFGTGGVGSKISAAKKVGSYGISTLIVNGKTKDILATALKEDVDGTVFTPPLRV